MSLLGLAFNNLSAQRANQALFQDLNFELKAGEVLQILGANGVGKSTLLKILASLVEPEAGSIQWQGRNIQDDRASYRQQLSYLGHHLALKTNLSVSENLGPNDRLDIILNQLGLAAFQDAEVATLSQGQKQRVAIARVLLANKKLWILDEPFAALDHQAFERVQLFIQEHVATGACVVLSSHRALEFKQNVKTLNL